MLWIQKVQHFQLCHLYVQELSFCSYIYLWFSVSSKIILHPPISRWLCGIHHGPPSTWSLSINFNSLSEKLTKSLPSSALQVVWPNGKFFTLNNKFTSLAFDQVISPAFDSNSCIHIPWIVLIVPWGPLSLLVVSLGLVSSSHHWLVIKRLSSMFDVNTSIHMLWYVLWLGRVGECKNLDSDDKSLACKVVWHGYDDMHVSLRWLVVIRPWVIICDPSHYLMAATIPWFHYDPLW